VRVNIVGLGNGWHECPTGKGEGSVWGINELITRRPVDATFDMHDIPAILSGKKKQKRRTLEKLKAQLFRVRETNTPMYSLNKWDGLPCTRYPIEKIIDRFGVSLFTGTVDYALAFALYNNYSSINLYGINYYGGWEYNNQRHGAHYWIGRAHEHGVEVIIHGKESTLMKTCNNLVYGYEIKQNDFFSTNWCLP
jgi:hypothetical protein